MSDKSNIELIKEWMETCPLLDGDTISVDYLMDELFSYSIDRTPTTPVVEPFVDGGGKKQITFDFSVTAPISSQSIVNLANSKFGEDLIKWVELQNDIGNLPSIDGAFSINPTSPSYILQKTETTAIYIIQFSFIYYELRRYENASI